MSQFPTQPIFWATNYFGRYDKWDSGSMNILI